MIFLPASPSSSRIRALSANLLLLCAAVFATPAQGEALVLHVAPQGNDHWSGRLPSPAPGGADGPLATLQGARDVIRRLPAPRPAVNVVIAPGTYALTSPLELTPEDSGRADAPIIYQGAPGTPPLLTGGRILSGWTKEPDGTLSLRLPEVAGGKGSFEDLWINDRRATRARAPDTGWDRLADAGEAPFDASELPVKKGERRRLEHARQTYKLPPSIAALLPSPEEAAQYEGQLVIYHNWDVTRRFLSAVDPQAGTVQTTGKGMKPWNPIYGGSRFFIEGIPAAFDAPGEWILSRDGLLRYRPLAGETAATIQAVAPVSEQLLVLKGEPDLARFVEHVHFQNIAFAHSRRQTPPNGFGPLQAATDLGAAIVADGVRAIRFEDCPIRHIGGYALWFRKGCADSVVTHCTLNDLGGGGIRIGEVNIPEYETGRTGGITFDNNILADGGTAYAAAVGLWIGQSSENRITHNDISRFRYTGISVGWTWGYKPSTASKNLIAYNHLHQLGNDFMSDLSGIYTLGISPGTVIRGNVIHEIKRAEYGGWGIYLDEGSSGILVEGNLVYRTQSGGFYQHFGQNNTVRNNLFALSHEAQLDFARVENHTSLTFEKNIVYWDEEPLFARKWTKGNIVSSHNLYFSRAHGPDAKSFDGLTFAEWQQSGKDTGSLFTDPKLADPENGDFRLAPDSPAITQLGFVPIDSDKAGVYGDADWKTAAR